MKNIITFLLFFIFAQIAIADNKKDEISDIIRIDYEGASVETTPKLRVLSLAGTYYKTIEPDGRGSNCLQLEGDNSQLLSITNTKGDLLQPGKGVLLSMWIRGSSVYDSSDVRLSVQLADQIPVGASRIIASGILSGTTWTWLAAWYYRKQGASAPKAFLLEVPERTKVIIGDVLMTYSPENLPPDGRPRLRVEGEKIMAGKNRMLLQGINLSAYSSEDKYDYNRELTTTREDDYRKIAASGFNVVRLNLWYRALMSAGGWEWLNIHRLWAHRHGLRLILDLHAPPGGYQSPVYKGDYWKDTPEAKIWREQTLRFWQEAARRFHNDPVIAAFDLFNEPKPEHDAQWWDFVRKAVKLIRDEGFMQPVIVESSFAPDSEYELLDDEGIIYDYHFYDPWFFASGQGGEYNSACLPEEKGIVLNKEWLKEDLKKGALNFAQQHKVPLNTGEYGIAQDALKNGGLLWLKDLTDILDEYNINRQYWCWHTYGDFSIERSGRNRHDPPEVDEMVLSVISIKNRRINKVMKTGGLVAFWDFKKNDNGTWISYYDSAAVDRSFPVYLRQIGDTVAHNPGNWPYRDAESCLLTDNCGPFGHAVRFNKGYIFGEVPHRDFETTPLNLHGRKPFSIIAWVKFTGQRHMVTGIWDEGGWNKYSGRRQAALFSGLFGKQNVIGHVSATGASSFPQSEVEGSQYARQRAIDGKSFDNDRWVAMAMTYDPVHSEVKAFLNGIFTPWYQTDPVAQDVFRYKDKVSANPFHFDWPLYSPRNFILKYNGYSVEKSGVYEHWLEIDLDQNCVVYGLDQKKDIKRNTKYRVKFDIRRQGTGLLSKPLKFKAIHGKKMIWSVDNSIQPGDIIVTSLEEKLGNKWAEVGTEVQYTISEGAPFTFGRALGLGSEKINEGTELYMDGVAVFNRVLSMDELRVLSFLE